MACEHCKLYGDDNHSFKVVGRSSTFGRIIYTCISRARDYSNRKSILTHIENVLEQEKGAWTWVFDCKDIAMKHTMQLDVAIAIANLIKKKYRDFLQRIVVINPTSGVDTVIKHVLPIFSPDSLQYLSRVKGGLLEIYMGLKGLNIEEDNMAALIGAMKENWGRPAF